MHASAMPIPQPTPRIANILFATDFSPCSRASLPYACALAKRHRATLHLINIVGGHPIIGPLGTSYAEAEDDDQKALHELTSMADTPIVKSLQHECTVHRGNVTETVCRIVDERRIDLVVMATHGRHGVRQFVLGSVAESVFRRAHCPVLTIGPGSTKYGPAEGRFAKIVASIDLSPASLNVFDYAHALALANESELLLFHAVEESPEFAISFPDYLDEAVVNARKRLSELLPRDLKKADMSIQIGSPAEMILRAATDREADLIVIGARRAALLAAHNPWAVAHEIVCAAPCPVLTVPH